MTIRWIHRLRRQFRALLRREALEHELDEELRAHVAMEVEELVRTRGLAPEEARRQALIAFGGVERYKEQVREARGVRGLERLAQDLRYGLRSLRSAPAFTATAVLILALGIGTATAMFTVFRAVVLQGLPVRDPDRLVVLWPFRDPTVTLALRGDQIDKVRASEMRMVSDLAGFLHFGTLQPPLTEGDRRLPLSVAIVTANFFEVLGARPMLGRLLRPEDRLASARVAVISYRTWQRYFGGDPGVLGRRLTLPSDQESRTIVGVAPPGLDFPTGVDYWLAVERVLRPGQGFHVVGRLAPDATPEAARSEFFSVVRRVSRERSIPLYARGAGVRSLTRAMLGDSKPVLTALTAAVGLLLLIACVNVGNLLLLRASVRVREIVIRRAVGASYGQVARLLLVESTLLGAAGGVLGLACAAALVRILLAAQPPELPRIDVVQLAGTPVGVATAVTFVAVLLFGVLPALAGARGHLTSALRHDARSGSESRRRRRVRQTLVASQVALALVMLAGAGLLVRSLQRLQQLELGYDTNDLYIGQLAIPHAKYDSAAERMVMFEEVFRRLGAVPGVTAMTPIAVQPFVGAHVWRAPVYPEGQSEAEAEASAPVAVEAGGIEYFRTFGIPILRGRGFLDTDRPGAPRVAVVSEAVARRYWPGENPVGKRFRGPASNAWLTVVGVAGDIRFRRLREPTPTIFLPWRQFGTPGYFAARTHGEPGAVVAAMRRAVREFDPELDVWQLATMDDYLDKPLAQPRLSTLLFSGFGLVALLLSALGLYGVMASAVRERTRDLGIRVALGATPARLRGEVLRGALVLAAAGAAIGLGGALVGSQLLTALLFEVSPTDPVTLAGVCALLLAVAVMAAYIPARRATRVNPVEALRAD